MSRVVLATGVVIAGIWIAIFVLDPTGFNQRLLALVIGVAIGLGILSAAARIPTTFVRTITSFRPGRRPAAALETVVRETVEEGSIVETPRPARRQPRPARDQRGRRTVTPVRR